MVGSIELTAEGTSENDVYAFTGNAGQLVTVEVLSAVLAHRLADEIDATVSLYDSDGNLLDYYGQAAVNDDGISSQDPLLLDIMLPADGTYFAVVDTYWNSSGPEADIDTGDYELFLYKYTVDAGPAARR